MQIHGSCCALGDDGVLMTGASGSGKSDLVLRLLDLGFMLVADDRVMIDGGIACAPGPLRGLLEVRGLGIVRLPYRARARVRLVVRLCGQAGVARLPEPRMDAALDVPVVMIDPAQASAPARVALALRCATGAVAQLAGAFAA